MFRWLIGASLRFRFLVVAAAIALLAGGLAQVRRMPVDVFPEFAPPKVEIQTEGIGMTSREIEDLVTIPMEDALRGVPGVEIVRSSSTVGLSQVVLLFSTGTDLMAARQAVQERLKLARAELPRSAGLPVVLQPLSSTSRVMKIGITSTVHDLKDLSMIAYWTMRARLLAVDGVANVPIWGLRLKTVDVEVDPVRMQAHGVTLDGLMQSTSGALDIGLLPYTAAAKTRIDGMIDTPSQRLVIHQRSPVFSPEQLAVVPIAAADPREAATTLADVADVRWGTRPLIGDAVVNDEAGLLMIVEKLPWANTLDVTRGVEAALAGMRPGLPGLSIDATIFRPATFIEQSMRNLAIALVTGAILVIIVLGAFLLDWRAALISVVAIPLSLVTAAVVLHALGATLNVMLLAGFVVALGSVVDDAIIDVENVVRRLREDRAAPSGRSTARIVLDASLEVRPAIWQATLIIALAVVPVFFMGGLSGAFFEPLALAYMLAMLASIVVATTVTPALCLILLGQGGVADRTPPVAAWLRLRYERTLARILRAPVATFGAALAVAVAGAALLPTFGTSLLPAFRESDFLMHWVPAEGTSHPETFRITERASRELRALPGVGSFGAHIGRAIGGDEPYGVNFTENWVHLAPGADHDATRAAIERTVAGYPGVYRDVQTYLRERIKEVLTGAGESIVVRLYGSDLAVLRDQAQRVHDAIRDVPGLIDLHVEQQVDVPQVRIRADLDAAARLGLKPGDIRRAAALFVAGIEVSDIRRDGKVYGVWLWTPPAARLDVESIREFPIDTPNGGRVRLREVADVDIVPTPNLIRRENASRRLDVHANVRGRDLGAVADEVEERLESMVFPLGTYPHLLGEHREREQAEDRLVNASLVVVAAILLLLHASLASWRRAGLIFLALPAALAGGLIAVALGDRVLSLGSLVGMITVLGIAARNGILLFHHLRHLEAVERMPFGPALVLRGAGERLAPILMTTLCTTMALVPLVVRGDVPGHEIEHPMAVVILGGLVTSTLLTLFVLPALYLRVEGARRSRRMPALAESHR
ncbi:MAG: efflux RND transporter permease subunit [Betaproteobacteria bacterium]